MAGKNQLEEVLKYLDNSGKDLLILLGDVIRYFIEGDIEVVYAIIGLLTLVFILKIMEGENGFFGFKIRKRISLIPTDIFDYQLVSKLASNGQYPLTFSKEGNEVYWTYNMSLIVWNVLEKTKMTHDLKYLNVLWDDKVHNLFLICKEMLSVAKIGPSKYVMGNQNGFVVVYDTEKKKIKNCSKVVDWSIKKIIGIEQSTTFILIGESDLYACKYSEVSSRDGDLHKISLDFDLSDYYITNAIPMRNRKEILISVRDKDTEKLYTRILSLRLKDNKLKVLNEVMIPSKILYEFSVSLSRKVYHAIDFMKNEVLRIKKNGKIISESKLDDNRIESLQTNKNGQHSIFLTSKGGVRIYDHKYKLFLNQGDYNFNSHYLGKMDIYHWKTRLLIFPISPVEIACYRARVEFTFSR